MTVLVQSRAVVRRSDRKDAAVLSKVGNQMSVECTSRFHTGSGRSPPRTCISPELLLQIPFAGTGVVILRRFRPVSAFPGYASKRFRVTHGRGYRKNGFFRIFCSEGICEGLEISLGSTVADNLAVSIHSERLCRKKGGSNVFSARILLRCLLVPHERLPSAVQVSPD